MFFNSIKPKYKRLVTLVCGFILSFAIFNPIIVQAADTAESVEATNAASPSATEYNNFKFPAINLSVDIPDEFACFTQNTTSNNAYLEKIGASNAEGIRNNMIANHIYLEAVLKETEGVDYEIIIAGEKLSDTSITDLSTLSQSELNDLFEEYKSKIDKKTDNTTETLTHGSIKKLGDATYFCTNIKVTTSTNTDILIKKYYTIKNGYYYTFSIQTTKENISKDMAKSLEKIVLSSKYEEIKTGLFDNPILSEVFSTAITCLTPVVILGVIFFVSVKMTSKKKTL